MKTITQTGTREIEVQEQEPPTPNASEVLVEVHSAGLCGSDAHAYTYQEGYEWVPIPRIMGHEYSGTVIEVGDEVTNFSINDHVVEEPIHNCGKCFQCKSGQSNICENFSITGLHRDGAYAEYVTIEEDFTHHIPDFIPLEHAAITEPTSIATHAVFTRSSVTPDDTVLIEGPGPIGILTAIVVDSMGATVLMSGMASDTHYRLPLAEKLGIDTINIEKQSISEYQKTSTDGVGFDTIFDMTGHHTGLEMAINNVRKGGEVILGGLPDAPSELLMTPAVRGEVTIQTSYGSNWTNFEQAIFMIKNNHETIEKIIDNSYDIDDSTIAFDDFLDSKTCKPVFKFV